MNKATSPIYCINVCVFVYLCVYIYIYIYISLKYSHIHSHKNRNSPWICLYFSCVVGLIYFKFSVFCDEVFAV